MKPPKNQILASKYFNESIGSFEIKMLNVNRISWRNNSIINGLLIYFLISARLFKSSINHNAVERIKSGSAGVDNDRLPIVISIDMVKLASNT